MATSLSAPASGCIFTTTTWFNGPRCEGAPAVRELTLYTLNQGKPKTGSSIFFAQLEPQRRQTGGDETG